MFVRRFLGQVGGGYGGFLGLRWGGAFWWRRGGGLRVLVGFTNLDTQKKGDILLGGFLNMVLGYRLVA